MTNRAKYVEDQIVKLGYKFAGFGDGNFKYKSKNGIISFYYDLELLCVPLGNGSSTLPMNTALAILKNNPQ